MQKPFAELMSALKKALRKQHQQERRDRLERGRAPEPSPRATVGGAALSPALSDERPGEGDEARFMREMQGVKPLEERGNFVPVQQRVRTAPPRNDDAEALAELADLVEGRASFDITNSDEFIEGIAHGLDRRLLRRLRRGYFSVQGHIDLHGRTRQEARELLPRFIADARRHGRRCVLIVHGRGLNSKDQIPVLKESLKVWLTRGAMSRAVLAFCTARPADGGAGAVYVLLRK